MCCPPSGFTGAPSAFGLSRDEARAAARQYIAEKKQQEAAQTNDAASVPTNRTSASDQDSDSMHDVSKTPPRVSIVNADKKPRQSLGSRCREKLRKCLP